MTRTVAGLAIFAATLALTACGALRSDSPVPGPSVSDSPLQTVDAARTAPQWRAGDRWLYGVLFGTEQGIKVVEVVAVRDIGNSPFYVLRVGELEHFYTTKLEWAGHSRDKKVESRITPPLPWFTWPLEPGRRWLYHGTLQEPSGTVQRDDTFVVVGPEVIDVPAGRFNTLKIMHEGDRGDRNEYWYAPDVRSYVKWVWQKGTSRTEEQLRDYQPAPRG